MPGTIAAATATTVLPWKGALAFSEARRWPQKVSQPYSDGRVNLRMQANIDRREWRISRRLDYSEWETLRDFYSARDGAAESFYFYATLATHDETGESLTGRYLVRFQGALPMTYNLGYISTDFRLVEVA